MTRELEKARAVKDRLVRGEVILAAQIGLTDPAVVEILGDSGFDVLIVDAEHCPHSPENVQAMLQAGVAGRSRRARTAAETRPRSHPPLPRPRLARQSSAHSSRPQTRRSVWWRPAATRPRAAAATAHAAPAATAQPLVDTSRPPTTRCFASRSSSRQRRSRTSTRSSRSRVSTRFASARSISRSASECRWSTSPAPTSRRSRP